MSTVCAEDPTLGLNCASKEERRLRAVIESSREVLCLIGEDLCVLYVSPSVFRLLGYSPAELEGTPIVNRFHSETQRQIKAVLLRDAHEGQESPYFESVLVHADGSSREVETAVTNLLDHPDIGAIAVNFREISHRRPRVTEYERGDGEFRTFLEAVGVGCAELEPLSGRVLRVNRKFCEIVGYNEGELLKTGLDLLADPEDQSTAWDECIRSLRDGEPYHTTERRWHRRDGTCIWVQLTGSLLPGGTGVPAKGIAVLRDVTDRRQAVEALQEARMELERRVDLRTLELANANQALETLIAASPLSIISVDLAGKIRRWNPAAERLFGWRETEVLGAPVSDLFSGEGDPMNQGAFHPPSHPVEAMRRHRSGNVIEVCEWRAPLFDPRGAHTGTMTILMDVTERKQLERALLDASEREQRRIGQDLHDHLCQHLLGVACVLKALASNAEKRAEADAGSLHQAARLVNEAVQQARDVARGLHPVELDSEGLMSALRELAQRTSAQVLCELECEPPVLIADSNAAMHFYRIAQEAVTNALRHAAASKIEIRLFQNRDEVILEVCDNGRGFTLRSSSSSGGMGLDIMKYRAHAIGGRLTLETQSTGGTRVTCSIPTPT